MVAPSDASEHRIGPVSDPADPLCALVLEQLGDGASNLALDELLLRRVSVESAAVETFLRFYGWPKPTLSLGMSQQASRVVDFGYCRRHGIAVVRRATGGKAVLHHREVTYSFISNDRSLFPAWSIQDTYRIISAALQQGLALLGIETNLAGTADGQRRSHRFHRSHACLATTLHHEILFAGKKLVGSAQRRTLRGFLQHGSILLDFDSCLLQGALRGKTLPNLASNVATLRSCLGEAPEFSAVISCLRDGFRQGLNVRIEACPLDPDMQSEAEVLGRTRLVAPCHSSS